MNMAAVRISRLRSLCSYRKFAKNPVEITRIRPLSALANRNYHSGESRVCSNGLGFLGLGSAVGNRGTRADDMEFRLSNSGMRLRISSPFGYRSFSSGNGSVKNTGAGSGDGGGFGGSDLPDKVKEVWNSTVEAVTNAGGKSKEVSVEVTSQVQQLLEVHPYLKDVFGPAGGTMVGTFLAWIVMPRLLRMIHRVMSGSSLSLGPVAYESSFWGALENPVRYLVTFMAFSQIGVMIAPTTVAAQYILPAWKGAAVLSFVWFLQRWKTNLIARALANKTGMDRDKLSTLDRASSVGLFVVGLMTLAEASGVAVQSLLTVGGVGGVATAFAARDILGNVLSGLSVQISQPFSVGDTIRAGSVEGQVKEIGFTTTSILTAENFPATVPNSLLSGQVIVNKSRAPWRSFNTKLPLQIDNWDVVPKITDEVKAMLRSNPDIFLERDAPYCYLSGVGKSHAELNLGCNLRYAGNKEQLFSAQQNILLQSVQIIKENGASLANYPEN